MELRANPVGGLRGAGAYSECWKDVMSAAVLAPLQRGAVET